MLLEDESRLVLLSLIPLMVLLFSMKMRMGVGEGGEDRARKGGRVKVREGRRPDCPPPPPLLLVVVIVLLHEIPFGLVVWTIVEIGIRVRWRSIEVV